MTAQDINLPNGQDLHQYARAFFDTLVPEEQQLYQASSLASALLAEIDDAGNAHKQDSELRKCAEAIQPFIAGIEQYAICIDVFANAHDLLAPIWGSVRIVLHVRTHTIMLFVFGNADY
jgi:hypothetical protein